MSVSQPLLAVENLRTTFRTRRGSVRAVDGVDLVVEPGEIVALLGESGCGKSATSLSIMGLLPKETGARVEGRILFEGRDLAALSRAELARLRGAQIAMIFQEPLSSLNPVLTAGEQIAEVLVRHGRGSRREAAARAVALLAEVGIADPERRAKGYPHELSGGMCQRVMIAMAIACDPKLLIADEPTTALDVTIQKQILALLDDLRTRRGMSVLFITHDLGVVAENADRVCVMYAGRVVEEATVRALFANPAHPYTRGLLDSMPALEHEGDRLPSIEGFVPDLLEPAPGCAFAPRCALADDHCRQSPPALEPIGEGRKVRCWKPLLRAVQ